MASFTLTPELLELVAARFKALAEPARLQILNALRDGEVDVTDLASATDLAHANVSKHLQLLHGLGFVDRRRDGPRVLYRLASDDVFRLCDIVCDRIAADADTLGRLVGEA